MKRTSRMMCAKDRVDGRGRERYIYIYIEREREGCVKFCPLKTMSTFYKF